MRRCLGITEPFWTTLSEDQRIIWKFSSRAIGIALALLVVKTGRPYLDWCIATVTAIFFMIAIETQRSYSKLNPRLRKACIRVIIFMGTWGIAVLGIAYFSQAVLLACAQVFANEISPNIGPDGSRPSAYILVLAFLFAMPVAIIRVFRQLRITELIYHLPRQGLKNLFMHRLHKATSFSTFAHAELVLMLICLMYASVVAAMTDAWMRILGF